MGANPHATSGSSATSGCPDFRDYAVDVDQPGMKLSEATRVLGRYLRDVIALNPDTFRIFGPDETASNRLGAVFETTAETWVAETVASR